MNKLKANRISVLVLRAAVWTCVFPFVASGCRNEKAWTAAEGDTVELRYASRISMVEHGAYTEVRLVDPWHEGRTLQRYLLVPRADSASVGQLPDGTVVYTPVERSVVFSSPHSYLLYQIGAENALAGVCDAGYIVMADLRKRVQDGSVADCGNSMSPSQEKLMEIHPQALLVSPYENGDGYARLARMGVPIVLCADYMETSALGRAEWMKFYGRLFGRRQQADSLFAVVENDYNRLKTMAGRLKSRPSILTERLTGSVWYCPGGQSSKGILLADAGSCYPFADDTSQGSLALSAETVMDKAADIDVWAFVKTGNHPVSRKELLGEYHGYAQLKAFRAGNVYTCNTLEKPFFEEISFRPDYLLREYVMLLHPELKLPGELRYFSRMEY